MFFIRIADITVCLKNKYSFSENFCRDYVIDACDEPDITVSATDEEISEEVDASGFGASSGYAECICLYRNLCKTLPERFGAYLMHCAVIEYEGEGYAFAARSGTGKSTHVALWQKRFGEGVRIVNGDKPIMRFVDGRLRAYGTPWCGKEGFNENTSVPLRAICFLERAQMNDIRRITPADALMRIFSQILSPETLASADTLFPLLDRTLNEVPCFVLGCNISEEAAEVAYRGMNEDMEEN